MTSCSSELEIPSNEPISWLPSLHPMTAPSTSRGRRAQERITRAANRLFQERDYNDVGVHDIAQASGISVGSFYRYYSNKEELMLWLLNRVLWQMYEATRGTWNKSASVVANLESTTKKYLYAYWENRLLLRAAFGLAAKSDKVDAMWRAMRKELYSHMLVQLRKDQSVSQLSPLDPEITMRALGGMVDEYARRAFAYEEYGPASQAEIAPAAEILARIWARALFGATCEE